MIKAIPKTYEADNFEGSSLHSGDNAPYSDECPYESHTVVLTRSPGFGFGFALSGGIDEPPIENGGDRAVYVSDVLRAGPADGKLRLFDRISSVNGISLGGVDNASAVGILRDAGSVVSLVIHRRQSTSADSRAPFFPTVKSLSLTRKGKNYDFGLVLGARLYVKAILPNSPAATVKSPTRLHEGDIILKLNDISTEDLTLNEARKILEKARERVDLTVLPLVSTPAPSGQSNEVSVENTDVSNEGVHHDANSLTSWSLSSLNAKSGHVNGHVNGGVSIYSSNTLTGFRSPKVNSHGLNRKPSILASVEQDQGISAEENARIISFCKEGSVGIRLVGGNRSGIYIADVQPGSVAASAGLLSGDHILRVNDFDYRQLTREEAVMHLLQAGKLVNMVVEHRPENMSSLLGDVTVDGISNSGGDSFYVRANFDYSAGANSEPGQLMFRTGDILHVTDTLYNGTIGCWFAARLSHNNMEVERGIIPNLTRGEQIKIIQKRQVAATAESGHISAFGTLDRASAKLFGRAKPRRAKSLSRDYWDSMSNRSQSEDQKSTTSSVSEKRPAYERVRLVEPGTEFRRPVVVYGPVGDLARHRLTTEFPAVFESPLGESQQSQPVSNGNMPPASKVIRLRAIRQVMERGRHAVLDITPNSVDKLVDAGFHPIVIFVKCVPDQRQFIKDAQQRLGWHSTKATKKLLAESIRLEASFSRLFSAIVTLTPSDQWFVRLRQAIELSQNTAIWVPDSGAELKEKSVGIPQINGNAFIMPSSNVSVGGEEDDEEVNGNGWKQSHPFATIRHMRNNERPITSQHVTRANPSTVSSSAITSSIDTPGSYATLPSRRALPLPPPPPLPPNGSSASSTPLSKQAPQQRTPSEYANFATLRTPPTSAAVAVPPVIPQTGTPQETASPEPNHFDFAMMASTASTVIEHNIGSAQTAVTQEQHYKSLVGMVSPQQSAEQQQQQTPNTSTGSPQSLESRVYPSFYADEQLSNDQRATINTYGTLSRPRHSGGKLSRTSLLAQTDFRSPIIEAKEFEQTNGNAVSEELERPVPAVSKAAPPVTGNYAPLTSSHPTSPYSDHIAKAYGSEPKKISSPMSDRLQRDTTHYQTPASPASASRYASLHLVPRPYRKTPNHFQMLHGSLGDGDSVNSDFQMIDATPPNATPEKPPLETTRTTPLQGSRQAASRGLWQNIERPAAQQKNSSPTTGHPAVSTDPLVLDTVRASVDYAGGVLESKATGVSLNIPRGALPPVVRQEVYFRVCSEPGAIAALQQQPNATSQEHGVTPVVMCGPPGLVFRRQVELRLPRAVRIRLAASVSQPPMCYGPVDADQIMSVFIDHF